jgi:uncharacterized protein (TIGR02996 family)
MRSREDYLREIVARPGDDEPRLAYADWLADQGDPRGTFIRTQVRLANLDRPNPRCVPLIAQERELLRRHEWTWRDELPEFPGIRWGRFARGFVVEVVAECISIFGWKASQLCAAQPIEELRVRCLNRGDDLSRCRSLARIRSLSLCGAGLSNRAIQRLSASSYTHQLTRIDISENPLDGDALHSLVCAPALCGLTEIIARDCHLTDMDIRRMLSVGGLIDLGRLRRLDLSHNQLGDDAALALYRAQSLGGLTALNLAGNSLSEVGSQVLRSRFPFAELAGQVWPPEPVSSLADLYPYFPEP